MSAATQANLALRSATAARASSQAITEPANTAITVVAPFTGQDIDADFVVLVAEQARAVGAEQAAAAERRAAEALEAARLAQEAAQRAAAEVKPAFDAAAAAAQSSAAAARSAADAQKWAAEAAADGAAARAAAARANQADAQAREDAARARRAANAAANDAAIAGRSASAAEADARAANSAASRAETDAAEARGAASRAETFATEASAAADSAQSHADAAAVAAQNAYNSAVDAGRAAERAEAAERERAQAAQNAAASSDGDSGLTPEEEAEFLKGMSPEAIAEYRQAAEDAKKGIIDYIIANGGQVLLDVIGYTDAKKCFTEGDVAACLWTVVNVGSLLTLIAKLPAVSAAIVKLVAGLTKFLEASTAGRKILSTIREIADRYRKIPACPVGRAASAGESFATANDPAECIPTPLGRKSTGRTEAHSLHEKLAMDETMSNPKAGKELPFPMTDPTWPASEGWVKMAQNVNGVEIHYVFNKVTGHVDDYKFK